MRQQKILGTVEELPRIIDQLEVHGVSVERVVVMEPFEKLSPRGGQVCWSLSGGSDVKVDWIVERLGFGQSRRARTDAMPDPSLMSILVASSRFRTRSRWGSSRLASMDM